MNTIVLVVVCLFFIITPSVAECLSNEHAVIVERQYGKYDMTNEIFCIYKASEQGNTCLLSLTGTENDESKKYSYTVCLLPNTEYILKLYGTSAYSRWCAGSYVSIVYNNHILLSELSPRQLPLYFPFKTTFQTQCSLTQIPTYIFHYTTYMSDHSTFKLIDADTQAVVKTITTTNSNYMYGTTYEQCLEQNHNYLITASDTYEDGWYVANEDIPYITIRSYDNFEFVPPFTLMKQSLLNYKFTTRTACLNTETRIYIKRYFDNYPNDEIASINTVENSQSITFYQILGRNGDQERQKTYSVCLLRNHQYSLTMNDAYDDYWETASRIEIFSSNFELLVNTTYSSTSPTTQFMTPNTSVESTCEASGEWPATSSGTYSTLSCPPGYSGSRKRLCEGTTLGTEINSCTLNTDPTVVPTVAPTIAPTTKPNSSIPMWVYIVIGVVIILIIVIIIICCCCCKQKKQNKLKSTTVPNRTV